jgi:pimeloyl-ACP methyl ester carboxylesterase
VKLLWAADDILTPPYFMAEFAERLPQAEATLLPSGGHGLSQSEPAAFAAEVLPFLRRYAA